MNAVNQVLNINDERLYVVEHDQTIRSADFKEAGSTYYKFSVLPQVVPRLRNGFGFTLDSLPLFSHLTPVFNLYEGSDGYRPNFMMTKPYNVNKLNAKIIEKQQVYQALMYEYGFTDEHPEDASRMGLIRPSDVFQVEESAKERVNYLKSLRKRYESSQANQLKRAPAKELRKEYDETLESLQLTSADLVEDFVSQLRGVTPSDHKKDYIY